MIYLASPYSHDDAKVREYRYREVCDATAQLLQLGYTVYSPIVHSVPLLPHFTDGSWDSFDAWRFPDLEMIELAEAVLVLTLDGWQVSSGIQQEVAYAAHKHKPVNSFESFINTGRFMSVDSVFPEYADQMKGE